MPGAGKPLKRRHIVAATLGNALEFYDFLTYSFFAIQIGHAFFPSDGAYGSLMASLATFGAGFAARPVGALVIGRFADRVGRKPAMLLSFILIGAAIFGMAVIPPYAAIGLAAPILAVLARLLQGFSLGGEIGSNTSFLLEAADENRRGYIVSWQGASQMLALLAGSLVGVVLSFALPPDLLDAYGWRIAFALGGLAVPFGLWLRLSLPETLDAMAAEADAPTGGMNTVSARHWRVMVLGLLALGAGAIGAYVQIYVVTYAQDTLHLSARAGFAAETANTIVAAPAILLGGLVSDWLGRRAVTVWGNLFYLAVIYPLFAWLVSVPSAPVLVVVSVALGLVANLTFGTLCTILVESLPQTIRSRGFGTVYSIAMAAFGGTTQYVVTWLIHVSGSAMAPAWYLLGATAIAQVCFLLIPENAPVRLRSAAVPLAATL